MTIAPHIRQIMPTDAEDVSQHIYSVVSSTSYMAGKEGTDAWLNTSYSEEKIIKKAVEQIGIGIWVSNELVACGFVNLTDGYISGLYVSAQRKGYGREILSRLVNLTTGKAYMSVHSLSPMRALAESIGFIDMGEDPDKSFFPEEEYRIYTLDNR